MACALDRTGNGADLAPVCVDFFLSITPEFIPAWAFIIQFVYMNDPSVAIHGLRNISCVSASHYASS